MFLSSFASLFSFQTNINDSEWSWEQGKNINRKSDYENKRGKILCARPKGRSGIAIRSDHIEVKSNLTIARGECGGDSGKRGLQELL